MPRRRAADEAVELRERVGGAVGNVNHLEASGLADVPRDGLSVAGGGGVDEANLHLRGSARVGARRDGADLERRRGGDEAEDEGVDHSDEVREGSDG